MNKLQASRCGRSVGRLGSYLDCWGVERRGRGEWVLLPLEDHGQGGLGSKNQGARAISHGGQVSTGEDGDEGDRERLWERDREGDDGRGNTKSCVVITY